MFDQAHLGRVWTSVEFEYEDDAGALQKRAFRFLVQPLTRAEYSDKRKKNITGTTDAVRLALSEATQDSGDDPVAQAVEKSERTLQRVVASIEASLAATDADVEMLVQRTHDWRLTDNAGTAVEFSRERLREMLQFDLFYAPLATRFDELCRGVVAKNSSPGPAGSAA